MTTVGDLIEGAQFRADLTNSDRVTITEWEALAAQAIRWAWREASKANPHAIATFADSTPTAGGSVSFDLPADFLSLLAVVANPDTAQEYTLARFNWQNRRASSGFALTSFSGLGLQYSEMGNRVYIEPAQRVTGSMTFRLWYVPQPFAVAPNSTTSLPFAVTGSVQAVADDGAGTGSSSLFFAGATLDDSFVGTDVTITGSASNNRSFTITSLDGPHHMYVTPAPVTEAFTTSVRATFVSPPLPSPLEQFDELLMVRMAIQAKGRDESDTNALEREQARLLGDLRSYFRLQRNSAGPQKMVDTDAMGPRRWGW